MRYLALCCIAKDEDPFFKEWLAYHALLGVEHFYIYDNMSVTPVRELLKGWLDEKRMTIRRVPGQRMQIAVYQDCLNSFGKDNFWIGFLDLDEFALPMRDDDLRPLLSEYEPCAGLAATWHLMTSSGHIGRPDGPVIKNYTEAFAEQQSFHVKCFIRPDKIASAHGPHTFIAKPGEYLVDENHVPVPPRQPLAFALGRKVRVNHYFVRSQRDFAQKLIRGGGARGQDAALEWVMFYETVARAAVEDTAIQRFLPALEKALAKDRLPEAPAPACPVNDYEALMLAVMRLAEAGKTETARLCLCAAAPHCGHKADFWLLRALLESNTGSLERQEIFLRESLKREALLPAYRQLAALYRRRGDTRTAAALESIIGRYGDGWEAMLGEWRS